MTRADVFRIQEKVLKGVDIQKPGAGDQVLDLFLAVTDEANRCCIFCKSDDSVGTMYRCGVVGEEGVEEGAQTTALWDASVQGEG